jgi:hypothetical protein
MIGRGCSLPLMIYYGTFQSKDNLGNERSLKTRKELFLSLLLILLNRRLNVFQLLFEIGAVNNILDSLQAFVEE